MKNEIYVPVDHDVPHMVTNSQLEKIMQGLPMQFNSLAIAKAAFALKADQSMFSKFFATLRVKYHNRKEIEILGAMEERVQVMSKGVASQIEYLNSLRDLVIATESLNTVGLDLEISQAKKEYELAEWRKKKADLDRPTTGGFTDHEQRLKDIREKGRRKAEEEVTGKATKIDRDFVIEEQKQEKLQELKMIYYERHDVDDISDLPGHIFEQYPAEKESIIDYFDNLKMG